MTVQAYAAKFGIPALPRRLERAAGLVVVAALALGVVVRVVPVLAADFPLNDGGLFSVMSRDLRDNGFVLPAFTSYNGNDIPFAYPPFGLYVNALLGPMFGDGEASLRVLPLVIACLTIPAFWFMLRPWVSSPIAAITTLAWSIIPSSWMWQVTGGGITRAFGMLFAFLAIGCVTRLLQTGDRRYWVLAPLFSGLTLLSHPESAAFVAVTVAGAWVAQDRSADSLRRLVIVGLLALAVASPWIIAVVASHGFGPLAVAGGSRIAFMNNALAMLLSLRWTSEWLFEVGAALGVIGLGLTLASGRWWLGAWIVAIFAILPGGAQTYSMVPWSMLVVVAVAHLARLASTRRGLALGAVVLIIALGASVWARFDRSVPLSSLSAVQRDAMSWVALETPPDGRFLVVTGSFWAVDATAEWFPVLAGRRSLGTIQGREFTSAEQWQSAVEASDDLERCADLDGQCVFEWMQRWGGVDYVFIPTGPAPGVDVPQCCVHLVDSMGSDPRFALRQQLAGGWIFAVER